jgi:hypothetical protein
MLQPSFMVEMLVEKENFWKNKKNEKRK